MELTTRRRRALSTVLALVLAIESVSAVAAVAQVTTSSTQAGARHALPAATPTGVVLAERGADPGMAAPLPAAAAAPPSEPRTIEIPDAPTLRPAARDTVASAPIPARAARAAASALKAPVRAAAPSRSTTSTGGGTQSAGPKSYRGRNHVWIPSLGLNRSVSWFPCDRARPPDNFVYRWGCAGANNVYLLGHAYSVFEPLHDAYVGGRLHKGMKAYYADAKGKVHLYTVRWWKLTRPTTDASWAWAAQSTPSMTLQTCVGRNSEYRLMVRLVEVR